mgnify:CR=1 FL=1
MTTRPDFDTPEYEQMMKQVEERIMQRREQYGFIFCPECNMGHTSKTLFCRECGYKVISDGSNRDECRKNSKKDT